MAKDERRKSKRLENVNAINVLCRFRPSRNINDVSKHIVIDQNSVQLQLEFSEKKIFSFDKIFKPETNQIDIFSEVEAVISSVISGFNGTILAYGQTNSGKSYTMEGVIDDDELRGIIPRAVDRLFESIYDSPEQLQFQLKLSYYEIYCEKVRDLLNPSQDNLKLSEVPGEGFVIQDLTEIYCGDKLTVIRAIQLGKTNRASAPTLMNAESSRSHSIVSILVKQKDDNTGRSRTGRLFLVDLAGSEKVSKTGASGVRLEEAKNINSSLTTLGMVINSLCDGAPHVPYRDSKLTRLLMDSLGGNSRTSMIICCSLDSSHIPETLSTLRFGERAKRIENHATVNEELSTSELLVLVELYKKEVAILKKQLANCVCGATVLEKNLSDKLEMTKNAIKEIVNITACGSSSSCSDMSVGAGTISDECSDVGVSLESSSVVGNWNDSHILLSGSEYVNASEQDDRSGVSAMGIASCMATPFYRTALIELDGNTGNTSPFHRSKLVLTDLDVADEDEDKDSDDLVMVPDDPFINNSDNNVFADPQQQQYQTIHKSTLVLLPSMVTSSPSTSFCMVNTSTLNMSHCSSEPDQQHLTDIRLAQLEAELDNERMKAIDANDASKSATAEANALRATIAELEDKLLRMKLDHSQAQATNRVEAHTQTQTNARDLFISLSPRDLTQQHRAAGCSSPSSSRHSQQQQQVPACIEVSASSPMSIVTGPLTGTTISNQHSFYTTEGSASTSSSVDHKSRISFALSSDVTDHLNASDADVDADDGQLKNRFSDDLQGHTTVYSHSQSGSSKGRRSSAKKDRDTIIPKESARSSCSGSSLFSNNDDTVDGDGDRDDPDAVAYAQSQEIRELIAQQLTLIDGPLFSSWRSKSKGRGHSIHTSASESKSAAGLEEEEEDLASYAERSTQLREEYEVYIQRLMVKLVQEQQSRARAQEKLEDALKQLWRASGDQQLLMHEQEVHRKQLKRSSSSSRRFSILEMLGFTPKDRDRDSSNSPTRRQSRHNSLGAMSVSSAGRSRLFSFGGTSVIDDEDDSEGAAVEPMTPHSLELTRSLDLATCKAKQLTTELETCQEAHAIVLETKDAMMRSLVKQNTLLVKESEIVNDRNQELEIKVQQLQQLLRAAVADNSYYAPPKSSKLSINTSFASSNSNSNNVVKTPIKHRTALNSDKHQSQSTTIPAVGEKVIIEF